MSPRASLFCTPSLPFYVTPSLPFYVTPSEARGLLRDAVPSEARRDAVPNEVRGDAVPSEARDASLSLDGTFLNSSFVSLDF
jgi:hypothetical protein